MNKLLILASLLALTACGETIPNPKRYSRTTTKQSKGNRNNDFPESPVK